jgi:hypothetical protein
LVRRFGEVAHLLLSAGLMVVSTTNAIGLADARAVQSLISDTPTILIDVDPAGDGTLPFDLRIRGTESEDDLVTRISDLLAQRQITFG